MDCASFVNCSTISWWREHAVVNIVSGQYPLLFFSYIQQQFHDAKYHNFQAIDLNACCYKALSAQLTTSFLGSRFIYWLKNFTDIDTKRRAYWTAFIEQYRGPHCILVYSDKKIVSAAGDYAIQVDFPDSLDLVAAELFLKNLVCTSQQNSQILLRSLFKGRKKISLDTLLLFVRYMEVAEADLENLLNQWLDLILEPEGSLFDLSKHLLAFNYQAFFKLWIVQGPQFPAIFWISYWSDIMWRAYHFTRLCQAGNNDQAKKIAARLPFNFVQGGWRQMSCLRLKHALDYLYCLDRDAKNGIMHPAFLDLFFLRFCLNRFASS